MFQMKTFGVSQLGNGNLLVTVVENGEIVIERSYEPSDLKSVVSLMLLTFPHVHPREHSH
jgi:hypothetical protein